MDIFFEIGIIIILAACVAYFARLLKQPLIPAYIITGLILGPILKLVTNQSLISSLSEIGIAFLLFVVGLEMDIKKLKEVGSFAIFGTLIQVSLVILFTWIISKFFGLPTIESIYLGFALAFSSTLVVIKLISDRKEINTLHARMILGILLMQDLISILALSGLGSFSQGGFNSLVLLIAISKGIFILTISLVISRFIIPPLFKHAAKSMEMLYLSALGTAFFFSILFNSLTPILDFISRILQINIHHLVYALFNPGFSFAIGAFFAGIVLGSLPYSFEIKSRVKSLKDFFIILFFVSLGMQVTFENITTLITPAIIFLIIIMILKPLIVMVIASFFGYMKRPSILTGLGLAQISEFSFILILDGHQKGLVSNDSITLIVLLSIISMTLTVYVMKYQNQIYKKLKFLHLLEKFSSRKKDPSNYEKMEYEVILCGYDRLGYSLLKTAAKLSKKLLVVDYDPEIVKKLTRQNIPALYGDISDSELLDEIGFEKANIIISTVPDFTANLLLINKAKSNHKTTVFVTAHQIDEAIQLYDAGADYVILPHFLGGQHVSLLMEHVQDNISNLIDIKLNHLKELHHRKHLGHEHPIRNY